MLKTIFQAWRELALSLAASVQPAPQQQAAGWTFLPTTSPATQATALNVTVLDSGGVVGVFPGDGVGRVGGGHGEGVLKVFQTIQQCLVFGRVQQDPDGLVVAQDEHFPLGGLDQQVRQGRASLGDGYDTVHG